MEYEKIYFDYNATSAPKAEVVEVMKDFFVKSHNPSSVHSFGREAKSAVERARKEVSNLAKADGYNIVFTSSGTEANNLALKGFKTDNYIISAIEHPSVIEVGKVLGATILPVNKNGIVNLLALEKILAGNSGKTLVSVMLANNETGVIQPIKEIMRIVYAHGGFVHCDAVQAFGKIPVNIQDLNVDMLTISSHKLGGPLGAAALIVKKGVELTPQILGGRQESSLRAGTENVPAIAGFGKAAELASQDVATFKRVKEIRDWLEYEISSLVPNAILLSDIEDRLPNTISIYMPDMKAETQVINFDLEAIAVSAGSACSSGKVNVSHVLTAMGLEWEIAKNIIRVSLSPESTMEEAKHFVEIWKSLYHRTSCKKKLLEAAA